MYKHTVFCLLLILMQSMASDGRVIINEIFYNAPNDLDSLQWIELFNPDDQPVDISNWGLNKGSLYLFAPGTVIEPHKFLVVALDPSIFSEHYPLSALGPLKRPLKRGKEKIELFDTQGKQIDKVNYKDEAPWPVSPDGYSSSLERICPVIDGDDSNNWAASPLPSVESKPSGTPGLPNSAYSPTLPPVISNVETEPESLLPGQPLTVKATIKSTTELQDVTLLYQVILNGVVYPEEALPMQWDNQNDWFSASIPGQPAHTLLRYRIKAVCQSNTTRLYPAENDIRPTLSMYVQDAWENAKLPFGFIIHPGQNWIEPENQEPRRRPQGFNFLGFGRNQTEAPRPPRGVSAFVYVDPTSQKTMTFDHINVIDRFNDRGYKVFFHKDQTWNGINSINIVFEGNERFLLAEALAFDLYHRVGSPAPSYDFLRLWVDGQLRGYHLMVERPNRNFLRRNNLNEDGDLFKLQWLGRDIASRYEKKTNPYSGHDQLIQLIDSLNSTEGMEQWKVIQEKINVDQVATYFALNMILSHWDGFFNNHFVYHDANGKNQWEIYPWDQDKTWGYYDGISRDDVFVDMPLTFGMEGDIPPSRRGRLNPEGSNPPEDRENSAPQIARATEPAPSQNNRPQRERTNRGSNPNFFDFEGIRMGGAMWWRAGGELSRPLLANPQFRQIFLQRVKSILESHYTEENFFPVIDALAERLKDDVMLLSLLYGEDGTQGHELLTQNVSSLKKHLRERREFLLNQEELKRLDSMLK